MDSVDGWWRMIRRGGGDTGCKRDMCFQRECCFVYARVNPQVESKYIFYDRANAIGARNMYKYACVFVCVYIYIYKNTVACFSLLKIHF